MKSVVKKKLKQETQNAFSLVELLVVLVIVASLIALAIPAINAMQKSFGSTGAEGMISTALSTARTLAIKNGHYAGVRFQKEYNIKDPQINAAQYMIFVVNDADISNVNEAFRAVEGYKPIKLPENVGVIDMIRRTSNADNATDPQTRYANERPLQESDLDDSDSANIYPNNNNMNITDTSAFSILFSPAGKLIIQDIRIRNKDGIFRPPDPDGKTSDDKVFNSTDSITINNIGQFVQDDYANFGLGGEQSRREFVLYDREKFEKMTTSTQRMNYLKELKPMYINPYTGEIIK
jgi:prepilin-type N-terminal cleavage/methylation domain-containing protein